MLETKDLILDKAKYSDWKGMYEHVWRRPEAAKYMMWNVTASERAAKVRIQKTIEFQKSHDTYLVYEKADGKPIGFAGVEKVEPLAYQEAGICLGPLAYQEVGICLGPDYVRRGFGTQIVVCLMQYCRNAFGAKEFIYSSRDENLASVKLARSLGFTLILAKPEIDRRDGHHYHMLRYRMEL
jgi:RimJ/RimL family protein N-acetyltransferase